MSLEMTICNGMRTQWNPLINLSLVHTGISPSRKLIPLLSSVAYSSHYSITSGKVDLIKHKPTVSACESLSVYDLRQPQQCSLVEFIIFVNIILPGSINPNILFRNGIVFLAYLVYLSTRTPQVSKMSDDGGDDKPRKCFNCRQEGHNSSDCPEPEVCRKCRKEV